MPRRETVVVSRGRLLGEGYLHGQEAWFRPGMNAVGFRDGLVLHGPELRDPRLHADAGAGTKAKFVLRPSNFDQEVAGISGPQYEFVVVGVETDDDLNVQTATWGTNGEFGGPMTMPANGALLTAVASSCSWAGLSFNDITGYTWKLFVTPVEIGDGNKYEKEAVVQVGVKAKGTATAANEPSVIGVAGEWGRHGRQRRAQRGRLLPL